VLTPIQEIIFGGFVSKVINDIVDVSKDKFRKAVKNKATKHQSIESQIYNITVDVLNKITSDQYKDNQDKIYDAAEVLLKSFKKNDGDELGCIKICLRNFYSVVEEKECSEFKVSLYKELGKDEYSELFRAILLLLLDRKNRYDNAVYEQLNQKLNEVGEKIDRLTEIVSSRNDNEIDLPKREPVKSRKQEYADNGEANISNANGEINAVQNNDEVDKKETSNISKKADRNYEIKSRVSKRVMKCVIFLTCICIFINCFRIYSTYNHYMDDAKYSRVNCDYIQATEYYHNALMEAKKLFFYRELYAKAACMEADCYFLIASEKEDNDVAFPYYAKAGGIYSEIINDRQNKGKDYYVNALSGLCFVYSNTEHVLDDEWGALIDLLWQEVEQIDETDISSANSNNIDDELICRWMRAYAALGEYYYVAIKTDYSFTYNPTITSIALKCYEKCDNLLSLIKERNKEVEILVDPLNYAKMKAQLMIYIARSPYIDNPDQYANQAIDLCQLYLSDASNYIKNDMESYIAFKLFKANGYCILAEYYSKDSQKSDEYMRKAYNELIPLLDKKSDKIPLEQIVDVGYSAIFTGYCSDGDLEKILDNYQELLSQNNINENPKEIARYALGICESCKYIIENYGFSQQAWEMGKQLSEDVKTIEEYVQPSQKENFDDFYDYFH